MKPLVIYQAPPTPYKSQIVAPETYIWNGTKKTLEARNHRHERWWMSSRLNPANQGQLQAQ